MLLRPQLLLLLQALFVSFNFPLWECDLIYFGYASFNSCVKSIYFLSLLWFCLFPILVGSGHLCLLLLQSQFQRCTQGQETLSVGGLTRPWSYINSRNFAACFSPVSFLLIFRSALFPSTKKRKASFDSVHLLKKKKGGTTRQDRQTDRPTDW